jgi:dTDP-4-dehydrorhamnose 3,5-epimerase-like enzyme
LAPRLLHNLVVTKVISVTRYMRGVVRWLHFQTKNPNLGKFWRVLKWKMLVFLMAIRNTLRQLGIFCGDLVI